jgi:hypothetical protein
MEVVGQLHVPTTVYQDRTQDTHWIESLLGPSSNIDVVALPLLRIEAYPSGIFCSFEVTDREVSILACKQCAFLTFIPSAFFSPLKKMVPECIE